MNDRNLNPAYHEALASARGISTTAPRAVGEFQGFIDGEPAVRWIDRKNMPNVGDKLFLDPARAAGIEPRMWSILLTSANHGTVGPLGSTFPHAGEQHERVQVVEIVEAGAAPSPGTDLAGLVRIEAHDLARNDDDLLEIARTFCAIAARMGDLSTEQRKHYPAPTEEGSPLLSAARAACVARGYTEDGLAVEGVTYPVAAQAGQVAVPEMTDEQIVAVWQAMPGGPEGWLKQFGYLQFARALLAVAPVPCAAGLLEEIAQSWDGCEYDGAGAETMDIGAALRQQFARFTAAPSAPAVAQQAPADWISVDERLPDGQICLATYRNAAGKLRIIRAKYARQFEVDAGEDAIDHGNCEYNEADDTYYLKAGWLECIDNWDEYSSIYVTEGEVTHWMPLPPLPGAQASTAGGRQEGGQS